MVSSRSKTGGGRLLESKRPDVTKTKQYIVGNVGRINTLRAKMLH